MYFNYSKLWEYIRSKYQRDLRPEYNNLDTRKSTTNIQKWIGIAITSLANVNIEMNLLILFICHNSSLSYFSQTNMNWISSNKSWLLQDLWSVQYILIQKTFFYILCSKTLSLLNKANGMNMLHNAYILMMIYNNLLLITLIEVSS